MALLQDTGKPIEEQSKIMMALQMIHTAYLEYVESMQAGEKKS
jgi:hypothetical protein